MFWGFIMQTYYQTEIYEGFDISKIVTVFWKDFSRVSDEYNKSCGTGESHNFWEVFFVVEGKHRVKVDNNIIDLSEGEITFYAPNKWHGGIKGYRPTAKVGIISFVCNSVYMNYFYNKKFKLDNVQRAYIKEAINLGSDTFESIECHPEYKGMRPKADADKTKLLKIKLLIEEFLSDIYIKDNKNDINAKRKGNDTVKKLICYMNENIYKNLSVEELAVYMSASALQELRHSLKKIWDAELLTILLI